MGPGAKPRFLPGLTIDQAAAGYSTLLATIFADAGWARALGIICLFACAISTFRLATAQPDGKT